MGSARAGTYLRLVGARLRADWQYRVSFLLVATAQCAATVLDLLAIVVLFTHVPALAGWTFPEVLFLYATSALAFGLSDLTVGPAGKVNWFIRHGHFDRLLIRPLGTLGQLASEEFALRRVGKLVQPAVALAVAVSSVPVDWTPARVVAVPALVATGAVLFGGLWVLAGSAAFWTVESQEVAHTFTYGGSYVTQYPLDVLSGWLRRVVVIVPLAFVNYLPAAWLLGKPEFVGVGPWAPVLAPVVAGAVAATAALSWRAGIRHYRSTGS
ncbi:MAG: ABC transporter permease [Acidimicrobiales bacterium]